MTKRKLLAVVVTSTALIASLPVAQAATTQFYPSHIYLNNKEITSADHIVANDPSSHQPTSWIPIYYLEATLRDLGITSTWSGTLWNLNVPASFSPNTSNPASGTVGANEVGIAINGVTVVIAPKLTAPDPSGGAETTYAPIYYVQVAMKRLGITPGWNGTNWTMTSAVNAGVTQTAMASAMWQVFNSTTWDVNTHPTEQQAGVTPTSGTVTAGDVATWLADWAGKAKGVTATWGPNNGKWVPYSLQYEVSNDPYTWASINGLYQGTSVSSASSVLTPNEVNQITSNLKWWLNGDKVMNGVNYLHVPFYSNYGMWLSDTTVAGGSTGMVPISAYQSILADETRYYDGITAKVVGSTIDMTLPNTAHSASNMAWDVIDGNWEYGGWQAKDNRGGKTIQIPNSNVWGFGIDTASLIPSMYLEGFQIAYVNVNGSPVFDQPYDWSENQNPPTK